jgi:hypothetical protein
MERGSQNSPQDSGWKKDKWDFSWFGGETGKGNLRLARARAFRDCFHPCESHRQA